MTAPLASEERELLEEVVAGRDPAIQSLAQDVIGGRTLAVSERNALRDAIGDELGESGIDEATGAIDDSGKRLDDLIDRIAALTALHDT